MAAEKTAESLGVPFRAANKMGDAVSDLARKHLPQWGMALGAAGIAVGAVTLLITHFISKKEEETKAREANIQKIRGELSEMEQLKLKTVEMIAAQKQMSDAKKAELLLDAPAQIDAKRAMLAKLEKSYADLGDRRDRAYSMIGIGQGASEITLVGKLDAEYARLGITINTTKAGIKELVALLQGASGKGKASLIEESNLYWKETLQRQAAGIDDMNTGYLRLRDQQIAFDQARLEQARLCDIRPLEQAVRYFK